MITLTTEQAQQIEEALMKIADLRNLGKIQPEVIAFETLYIIRAAIAQPVLWQSKIVADCVSTVEMFNDEWRPLYAAPVRTKDLTDDEIYTLYSEPCSDREMIAFARAVIQEFRRKNGIV